MRTRSEARREDEAAAAVVGAAAPAARHAALLALLPGPPHVLEAALAALGLPGSAPLQAALAYGDHALLRELCERAGGWGWFSAIPPVLHAYGESPGACADAVRVLHLNVGDEVLFDTDHTVLVSACCLGEAAAVDAMLGAYRRAGRAHEALAYGSHQALRCSAPHADIVSLLLAEYGEPGCGAVLAALASCRQLPLRCACGAPLCAVGGAAGGRLRASRMRSGA
jgi:hypothetical protein